MVEYQVRMQDGRVVLPASPACTGPVEVSTWDDAEDNLEAFAAARLPRKGIRTLTGAVLVHRADNTYNSNAISVSTPAADGGTLDERHLGYLRDHFLRKVGMWNLPDLIQFAGGEVECNVMLEDDYELSVVLPEPHVLGEAIRAFLNARGIDASGPPPEVLEEPEIHSHTRFHADTAEVLRSLATYENTANSVSSLRLVTERYGGVPGRSLAVRDEPTGRQLGRLAGGWLFPTDERDREVLVSLLLQQGIAVTRPVSDPQMAEDGSWHSDLIPNVYTRVRAGGLDLRTSDAEDDTFAVFNPTFDVLWVEDSRLVAPALRYMHRLGVDVRRVGLPRRAWSLDEEISYRALHDPQKPWQDDTNWRKPSLLKSSQALLPRGVLEADEVTWIDSPGSISPDPWLLTLERYVGERTTLFPVHELTGDIEPCRLCGRGAALFTTPIATQALAYCHVCLAAAVAGLVTNAARAGAALRALSALEFDGQPMLATQLDSLHVDPSAPVSAAAIDQMVLLRFGVTRKGVAWTRLLEAAGFAENGLRTGRGTLIRSRDGHLCLSLRERVVCDFLHQHGIEHEREPLYPLDPEYNRHGLRRADWLLPDGTLIELWGLPNDPHYASKMTQKRLLARRHALRLLEITDANLPKLPELLGEWLPSGPASPWQWSPQLVSSPVPPDAKTAIGAGDARGRNAFNFEAQQARVGRCADAVRLQEAGLTRAEISQQLGIAPDSVKMLLRDGKFYADPASDKPRRALAQLAAEARDQRMTRAQFEATAQITKPKAQEAWRDAAILFEPGSEEGWLRPPTFTTD